MAFRYGVPCKGCRAMTLNLAGWCNQCQAGAPSDASGPERVRRELMSRIPVVEPPWLGRLVDDAFGLAILGNNETQAGADAERERRVQALRWWLGTRHNEGGTVTLPPNYGEAVLAWQAAGCPSDDGRPVVLVAQPKRCAVCGREKSVEDYPRRMTGQRGGCCMVCRRARERKRSQCRRMAM